MARLPSSRESKHGRPVLVRVADVVEEVLHVLAEVVGERRLGARVDALAVGRVHGPALHEDVAPDAVVLLPALLVVR